MAKRATAARHDQRRLSLTHWVSRGRHPAGRGFAPNGVLFRGRAAVPGTATASPVALPRRSLRSGDLVATRIRGRARHPTGPVARLDEIGHRNPKRWEHEAVFTVARKLPSRARLHGGPHKNWFIKDKKPVFLSWRWDTHIDLQNHSQSRWAGGGQSELRAGRSCSWRCWGVPARPVTDVA